MKKLALTLAAAALLLGGLTLQRPTPVLAAPSIDSGPAFVLNFGRDGLLCFISDDQGLLGVGRATYVENDGGRILFSCRGVWLDPAPQRAALDQVDCGFGLGQIVVTPGGRFEAACHG